MELAGIAANHLDTLRVEVASTLSPIHRRAAHISSSVFGCHVLGLSDCDPAGPWFGPPSDFSLSHFSVHQLPLFNIPSQHRRVTDIPSSSQHSTFRLPTSAIPVAAAAPITQPLR
ncbi:hypothetical protein CGCF413_v013718 [Colletotrichum fructicola]|nr:hypothetical protein CGCF413_v013718 [Colletotrichum fructicola]